MNLQVYDSSGREKVIPSPSGAEVYVPVVLYDETLTSQAAFGTATIPDDIVNVEIIVTGRSARSGNDNDSLVIFFNGDSTGTNYWRAGHWFGTSHDDDSGNWNLIGVIPAATATAGYWGETRIWVPDIKRSDRKPVAYATSTNIRTTSSVFQHQYSCLWTTSAALTSVKVGCNNSPQQFVSGSRCQVLGYKVMNLGASVDPGICNGRLTLTSGTPVTTSDVTAATTVYFTPYLGNRIALYDGASWNIYTFTEKSISVPASTGTNYDIFAYLSNGSVTLETVAWTDDTTRATGLTLQNGIYVKSGSTEKRYLGSFRTTGVSGQTEDSITSRFLWNYYNQRTKKMRNTDVNAHVYTTGTWRYWNNTASNTLLEFVIGVQEDSIPLSVSARMDNGAVRGQMNDNSTQTIPQIYIADSSDINAGGSGWINLDSVGYQVAHVYEWGQSNNNFTQCEIELMFKG
jgi:hypothetical protein